jgi:hypothetical protein
MFEQFCQAFKVQCAKLNLVKSNIRSSSEPLNLATGALEFLTEFGGMSFGDDVYKVFTMDESIVWTHLVEQFFPQYSRGMIHCFAYDWLGRIFALDVNRRDKNEPLIIMVDISTGDVFNIPVTFLEFHNHEIIHYKNEALAYGIYKDWISKGHSSPSKGQCVGYTIPLFINGVDDDQNMAIADLNVYWNITGQLLLKAQDLPLDSVVGNISIS